MVLKCIIPLIGSKRKELNIIQKYEPNKIDKIVDVYGGAANVSMFYNDRGFKVHFNDILEDLFKLIKTISNKEKTEKLLIEFNKIENENDDETFYKIFDKKYNISSECRLLYLSSSSFRGHFNRRVPNYKQNTNKIKIVNRDYLKDYHEHMNLIKFTNKDYKLILDRYRNIKDVFLYLDPPYVSKKTNQYGITFTIEDLEYIKDFMKICDCNVMLHIDFTGYTYYNFKNMIKFVYPFKYKSSIKKKGSVYEKYHMIITNYDNFHKFKKQTTIPLFLKSTENLPKKKIRKAIKQKTKLNFKNY